MIHIFLIEYVVLLIDQPTYTSNSVLCTVNTGWFDDIKTKN